MDRVASAYADAEAEPVPRVFGVAFDDPVPDGGEARVVAGLRAARLPPLTLPIRFGAVVVDRVGGGGTLALDSTEAFGHGLHPTTAMMLSRLADHPPQGRVLDVGTGTGVLALASLQLGAAAAVGTDIAPGARRAAAANAARAGLQDKLRVASQIPAGPFDHGLANVRARPLVALAGSIAEALGPRAPLWLSGIRIHELDEVLQAYAELGFADEDRLEHDGWVCVALAR